MTEVGTGLPPTALPLLGTAARAAAAAAFCLACCQLHRDDSTAARRLSPRHPRPPRSRAAGAVPRAPRRRPAPAGDRERAPSRCVRPRPAAGTGLEAAPRTSAPHTAPRHAGAPGLPPARAHGRLRAPGRPQARSSACAPPAPGAPPSGGRCPRPAPCCEPLAERVPERVPEPVGPRSSRTYFQIGSGEAALRRWRCHRSRSLGSAACLCGVSASLTTCRT
ncbi:translation initiation factor IF-2-like [Cygnus olor]|uniref:translation initiation factor IF-2-like n=1 Tax=Cygnus olor TaxID=8869 RepID=UPI001ADE0730|nr:translation initiation factor IF-2-like [Cygnus olor]